MMSDELRTLSSTVTEMGGLFYRSSYSRTPDRPAAGHHAPVAALQNHDMLQRESKTVGIPLSSTFAQGRAVKSPKLGNRGTLEGSRAKAAPANWAPAHA